MPKQPKPATFAQARRGPDGRFQRPLPPIDERAQAEYVAGQILQRVPQVAALGDTYLTTQLRALGCPEAWAAVAILNARQRAR